ncbi:MAG TPA: hypothetical protein VHF28_05350 [Nitrososphaera sp.]|nr:hypothetical protein [Nitrososphaera sp.]
MVWKFDVDDADASFSPSRDKYIEKLDHVIKELTSCRDAKAISFGGILIIRPDYQVLSFIGSCETEKSQKRALFDLNMKAIFAW